MTNSTVPPTSSNLDIENEVFSAGFGIQTLTRGTYVVQRPGWYQVLSPGTPSPSRNEVIHSELRLDECERAIDATIQQYGDIGTPFKWCTSPRTQPESFGDLLEKRGFGSWPTRGMYAWISELKIAFPEGVTYERVDQSNLKEYVETSLSGWILDRDPTDLEREQLTEDMRWVATHLGSKAQHFLARVDGVAAGTAGFYLKERSGYLVGGNVLKKFRGRGVYRGLIAERFRALREMDLELAVTGARERTSAPILERIGFSTAYRDRVYQYGGTLPE